MDELVEMKEEIPNSVVIFVVATYGEGDPTDNALPLFEWMKEEQVQIYIIGIKVSAIFLRLEMPERSGDLEAPQYL